MSRLYPPVRRQGECAAEKDRVLVDAPILLSIMSGEGEVWTGFNDPCQKLCDWPGCIPSFLSSTVQCLTVLVCACCYYEYYGEALLSACSRKDREFEPSFEVSAMASRIIHGDWLAGASCCWISHTGFATFLNSTFPVRASFISFQLDGTMALPSSLLAITTPNSLPPVLM